MTDWRTLGYVPDSEGEDSDEYRLSPLRETVPVTTEKPVEPAESIAGRTDSPKAAVTKEYDVYELPPSSLDTNETATPALRRGRGRPPKRGRGNKRLSLESSGRAKKQARLDGAEDVGSDARQSDVNTEAISEPGPTDGVGEVTDVIGGISSPARSAANLELDELDSTREDVEKADRSENTLYSVELGTDLDKPRSEILGPSEAVVSIAEDPDLIHSLQVPIEPGTPLLRGTSDNGVDSETEGHPYAHSVLPSSPPVFARSSRIEVVIANPQVRSSSPSLLNPQANGTPNRGGRVITSDDYTAGRTFRPRTQLQLHPFMVEQERYVRTMHERGMKALKLSTIAADPAHKPATEKQVSNEDSQDGDFVVPDGEAINNGTQEDATTESVPSVQAAAASLTSSQADDMPQVEDLFRESTRERAASFGTRHVYHGKRQKTKALSGLTAKSRKIISRAQDLVSRTHERSLSENVISLQTPIDHPAETRDIFDLDSTPDATPVETPHSVPKRRHIVISDESSEEGGPPSKAPSPAQRYGMGLDSSSSSSSSSDSDDYQQRLLERENRRYKARLKGTLPASFTKFNPLKPRGSTHQAPVVPRSPEKRGPVPGMAQIRKRSGPRPELGSADNPYGLSDGDDSDDSPVFMGDMDLDGQDDPPPASAARSTPIRREERISSSPWPISIGGAREHDEIDRMVSRPSGARSGASRKSTSSKTSKLKQSRITSHATSNRQTNGASKRSSKQSTARRAPRLGVIDACRYHKKTKGTEPPNFMRVAERNVRKRKDQGRQLPYRKVIIIDRLYDDETDVEDTLRRWRRGKLKSPDSDSRSTQREKEKPSLQDASRASATQMHQSSNHPTAPVFVVRELKAMDSTRPVQHSDPVTKRSIPKVKYKAMNKPIAILSGNAQPRIDEIFKMRPPMSVLDPIEIDDAEEESPQQLRFKPLSEPYQMRRPNPPTKPQQFVTNEHGKVFQADGRPLRPGQRVPRKQQPKRIDRNRPRHIFQPPERLLTPPDVVQVSDDEKTETGQTKEFPAFQNLPKLGVRFSNNFDVHVPELKMLFSDATFIGGGDLAKALDTKPGDAIIRNGDARQLKVLDIRLDWGVYNDDVRSQFEDTISLMLETIEAAKSGTEGVSLFELSLECRSFLRYISRYLYESISFMNEGDIEIFASHFSAIVDNLRSRCHTQLETLDRNSLQSGSFRLLLLQIYTYGYLFLYQIGRVISNDYGVQQATNIIVRKTQYHRELLHELLRFGTEPLQTAFARQSQPIIQTGRLNESAVLLELWIILSQAHSRSTDMDFTFWESINEALSLPVLKESSDIVTLEAAWRHLFRLLSVTATDSTGKLSPGGDDHILPENWNFAKTLVTRALAIYSGTRPEKQRLANNYIHDLFSRCLTLVRDWKWRNVHTVIPAMYEFFIRRELNNLTDELDRGSPTFIQHLDTCNFKDDSTDTTFSIFLKIVAVGMKLTLETTRNPKSKNPDQTVKFLTTRIKPNHGRRLLNDQVLDVKDLYSYRNHHDLLTAIYYGTHTSEKPSIMDNAHRLVDAEKSHANVCSMSLRTWANMMTAELGGERNTDFLERLMKWHYDIIQKTMLVHKEVQTQADKERKTIFDPRELEDVERRLNGNKKQVEKVLMSGIDLLNNMFRNQNCDIATAQILLASDSMKSVFKMADALPTDVVLAAVRTVSSYVNFCRTFKYSSKTQDESQMSFDWGDFEDIESDSARKVAAEKLHKELYESFFTLIAKYFTGEKQQPDNILKACVEVWVQFGALLVDCDIKRWSEYFSLFRGSWFTLRDTDTKKQYSVYYVARILAEAPSAYEDHKEQILHTWVASLVEIDASLKFQHELTAVIFNHGLTNRLFKNMPFEIDEDLGTYKITLKKFGERRLSAISTFLQNMQEELVLSSGDNAKQRQLRTEFRDLTQIILDRMKENYKEIQLRPPQQDSDINSILAYTSPRNYETFCQQVIGALVQYTNDFSRVNEFISDASTHLPLDRTEYIASKLKYYAHKLVADGSGTEFGHWFYSTSAGVARDARQLTFSRQITDAFEAQKETDMIACGTSSLRQLCLLQIFGVYIANSMNGVANMLLSIPILSASIIAVHGLIEEFDSLSESWEMDQHISRLVVAMLESVRLALGCLEMNQFQQLNDLLGLYCFQLILQLTRECDVMVNHLAPRMTGISEGLSQDLLRLVVRLISRCRIHLHDKPLPDSLQSNFPNLGHEQLFEKETSLFGRIYKFEIKNWTVTNGSLYLSKTGRPVLWDHLLPTKFIDVVVAKRIVLQELDGALRDACLGVCERVVEETDEDIWWSCRMGGLAIADMLYPKEAHGNEGAGGVVVDLGEEFDGSGWE